MTYASFPLKSFLFVFNNGSISCFAAMNTSNENSPHFTIVVSSLRNHSLTEEIRSSNHGILSLYESCVGCPFSNEHPQLIPVRSKDLLSSLVNHHDTVNVQICCELSNGIKETIAALLFIEATNNEFVILFAAVTKKSYDNSFGSGNNGQPFRRKGLFFFLPILAVRLSFPTPAIFPNLLLFAMLLFLQVTRSNGLFLSRWNSDSLRHLSSIFCLCLVYRQMDCSH